VTEINNNVLVQSQHSNNTKTTRSKSIT